jgi:hypothetical protein
MNDSSLAGFYLALFAVTTAFAGVAIAAVIAVAQILQGILSFRTSRRIFATVVFRAFAITMVLAFTATGVPSFLLSFENHDFVPGANLHTEAILSSPAYAVATIALLIASLACFLLLVYEETRYLVPSHALAFFRESLAGAAGGEYLKSRYATPPLFLGPPLLSRMLGGDDTDTDAEPAASRPPPEPRETPEEEWARLEAKYDSDLTRYEIDKRRWERLDNPFAPIEYYIVQAVQKGDLPVLLSTLKTFEELIADGAKDKDYQSRLVRYYSEVLRHSTDIALQGALSSPLRYLVDSSRNVHEVLIQAKRLSTAEPIRSYLKDTADRSMGVMPSVFTQIMNAYREIGSDMMRTEELGWEDVQSLLDDVFRHLGWLGERLLDRGAPEVRPIMHDDEYETEFGSLINALLGIGGGYDRPRSDKYPLIYFDALYVIARSLTPYYRPGDKSKGNSEIGDMLFTLMYEKQSFAEAALKVRNSNGLALALLRLTDHARLARDAGLQEQVNDVMDALLDVGVLVASVGDDLPRSDLNSGNLADEIKDTITDYADPSDLVKEAREILIKFKPEVKHDVASAYVKDVGIALGVDWDGPGQYQGWSRGSSRW